MKLLVALVLAAAATGCPRQQPEYPRPSINGTLVGTVEVISGEPCPEPGPGCAGSADGYEVVIYQLDGTTILGKTTAAADGSFRARLPAGMYVILTPAGAGVPPQRTELEIQPDVETKVALRVDTGVRAAPTP